MITIYIRPPRDGSPFSVEDSVRRLAEYVAGLLGPLAVRSDGESKPPFWRDNGRYYQLDQGNDWVLLSSEEQGQDGSLKCTLDYRYRKHGEEKLAAVKAMLQAFTMYGVE